MGLEPARHGLQRGGDHRRAAAQRGPDHDAAQGHTGAGQEGRKRRGLRRDQRPLLRVVPGREVQRARVGFRRHERHGGGQLSTERAGWVGLQKHGAAAVAAIAVRAGRGHAEQGLPDPQRLGHRCRLGEDPAGRQRGQGDRRHADKLDDCRRLDQDPVYGRRRGQGRRRHKKQLDNRRGLDQGLVHGRDR